MVGHRMMSRLTALLALLASLSMSTVNAQDLTWAGDVTTFRAFMNDLAGLYQEEQGRTIALETVDASVALSRVGQQQVDMGGTSRPTINTLRDETRVALYPIVWDALVAVTHKDNRVRGLSLEQLQGILRGEITNWNELGGENAAIRIHDYNDPVSGLGYVVRSLLLNDAGANIPAARVHNDSAAVETAVVGDIHGIGVTTYSTARTIDGRIMRLDNVMASYQTIKDGDYLLFLPLYLAIREDGDKRREVKRFIRFAAGNTAKRLLRRNGVVPYTDGMTLVSKQLERESRMGIKNDDIF